MIERGFGAVPPGSVGRAPLSRRDGLSTCHCAFCHLFPGGPGAPGPPVGALRSTHSQAPGGDGPLPQLWQAGGRVLSGVGALTGRRRNKVCVRPEAGRTFRCCTGDSGSVFEKVLWRFHFFKLSTYDMAGSVLLSTVQSRSK